MPNFNRYSTAGDVINGAAAESGLTPVSDPFGSMDPAIVQLKYLLNTAGKELISAYPWQQLTKEANSTIAYGAANTFSLPEDFDRMLDQTGWDRTGDSPLSGPATAQQWQMIKGRVVTTEPSNVTFRYRGDTILIHPTPPAGSGTYADLFYEYISRAWVQDGTTSTTYRDYAIASADLVKYDTVLMIKLLKLRFLAAKGFDTTDISDQVSRAFAAATSKSTVASILSVAPVSVSDGQPWSGAIANGLPP